MVGFVEHHEVAVSPLLQLAEGPQLNSLALQSSSCFSPNFVSPTSFKSALHHLIQRWPLNSMTPEEYYLYMYVIRQPGLPTTDHYSVSPKKQPLFCPPCSKSSQSIFPQFAYKFTMEDPVKGKAKVKVYNIHCSPLIYRACHFCCRMQSGWSVSICSW